MYIRDGIYWDTSSQKWFNVLQRNLIITPYFRRLHKCNMAVNSLRLDNAIWQHGPWLVKIGWNNGLVSDRTKPLHELNVDWSSKIPLIITTFNLLLKLFVTNIHLTHLGRVTHLCVGKLDKHWFRHGDVIKWKHFPRYWPFVLGIHRWPANSPHKGQWRGVLMFSLICTWINGGVNNGEAGDLRGHRAHYDVTVMIVVCRKFLCDRINVREDIKNIF